MSIGWKFPPNNYGSEDGLNDPGIETFLSRPLESLAREVIQNSRDAAMDATKPVVVEFALYDVPRELFPGVSEFSKILNSCGEYWSENAKSRKFFAHAKQLLNQENITFLKISDYNTKGLAGAAEPRGKDWHKLTKSVGASDKREGKDGSFGIGKHAPFACSAFRTVFYGTKVEEDKTTAFQGVAKLVTHLDKSGEATQGTGYFGEKGKLQPILDVDTLDDFYRRRRFGTDIFIPGFIYGDDWDERVALSVIKNFFVSIHDGKLSVHVGEIRIDQTTLPQLMEQLVERKGASETIGFYRTLIDEDSHVFFDENFLGMGQIELNVVIGEDLPKQVAMVRQSGMLVYIKKRFKTPLRFSAVFIARGEKLNTFLTSLEPPAHDDWEPERHAEDVPYARSVLQKMHSWIVDKIRELSATTESEEIDPEGIGQFLPDDLDNEDGKNETDNSDEGDAHPRPVEMQVRATSPSAHRPTTGESDEGEDNSVAGVDSSGNRNGVNGDGVLVPGQEGVNGTGQDGQSGTVSGDGPDISVKASRVNLQRLRLFCSDSSTGEYMLAYTPDLSGDGTIQLNVVGEVGNEAAPIASVVDVASGEQYAVPREGTIGPITFVQGQKKELKVILKEHLRCAMEVSAHAS